jgi:hypothetical protein
MEALSAEGRMSFNKVARDAAEQHQCDQQELQALILSSVNSAVEAAMDRALDSSIRAYVSKAQADMQVYTDGVESTLLSAIESIRTQMDLTTLTNLSKFSRRRWVMRRSARVGTVCQRLHGGRA